MDNSYVSFYVALNICWHYSKAAIQHYKGRWYSTKIFIIKSNLIIINPRKKLSILIVKFITNINFASQIFHFNYFSLKHDDNDSYYWMLLLTLLINQITQKWDQFKYGWSLTLGFLALAKRGVLLCSMYLSLTVHSNSEQSNVCEFYNLLVHIF